MSQIKIDLNELVTSHVIDQQTADTIQKWYKEDQKNTGGSRFLAYFTNIGASVTGLGILLLIGANWENITDMMKTILIIGVTLGFYMAGYYFAYVKP
jgi:uncharacterized membrane protein